ncbi:DUF412 domain-containing protein [Colwellia ponticola]|uniref:UPF0208 membrane protein YfbV n=2 Tax=Colwellia ponticola TaxID=2304625 RepID=A0A8H2JNQ8_9GAMM|nr:DUF412 domain-containing protein [Colwellia ponticola]
MKLSVVQLIKLGQKYLSLWPEKPELRNYFEEYQGVQSARFVCRYFPALALFTVIMQLYLTSGYHLGQGSVSHAIDALPQALVYGLFLLSLPIQALVFSGVKADKLLSPSLASWYHSRLAKIKQQGNQSDAKQGDYSSTTGDNNNALANLATYKPRYIDLAQLLQLTYPNAK